MRWRQRLEEWHRKKRICCPHCQVPLVGYTTNILTVELIGTEANILRVFHTECQEKTKGKWRQLSPGKPENDQMEICDSPALRERQKTAQKKLAIVLPLGKGRKWLHEKLAIVLP